MIPKRIIYCWFGRKEKPDNVKRCMESWKRHMPNWQYFEINEDNFDINYCDFVREAYEAKAWAFVSDVARLWALSAYGGIYLDTDVEVFQSLEKFLDNKCFTGWEQVGYPVTAVIGAEANCKIVKEMLGEYKDRHFELKENWWEYETNTVIMSEVIGKYINRAEHIEQMQESEEIVVYPRRYFTKNDTKFKEDSYCLHNMFGNWIGG